MARQDRTANPDLIESLVKEGSSFSFFQAIYLLECHICKSLKEGAKVDEKAIKLLPSISMGFPASDIVKIDQVGPEDNPSFEVETSFLGLYGSSSPLPAFYTEDLLWNDQAKTNVKGFLDLFHHRLLSLLYKCWCKNRFHIQFKSGGTDKFSEMMLALSGLNLTRLEKKDTSLSPVWFLKFSGLLTQRPKSSSTLKNILRSFFADVAIQIKEFVGKWDNIIPEQKNSLGKRNCRLGTDLSLGERVFNCTGSFRVVVYPETFKVYVSFLPEGKFFKQLLEIITLFSPSNLTFDIELKFPPGDVARLPLQYDKEVRLGFTSLLGEIKAGSSIIFSQIERFVQ